MKDQKIQWTRGKQNQYIVLLPDGNQVTSKILSEKLKMDIISANGRLKEYIETGNKKDLFRKKGKRRTSKKSKVKEEVIDQRYYLEGRDMRMFFDEQWKLISRNI